MLKKFWKNSERPSEPTIAQKVAAELRPGPRIIEQRKILNGAGRVALVHDPATNERFFRLRSIHYVAMELKQNSTCKTLDDFITYVEQCKVEETYYGFTR
jgi:hypothetical protein